MPRIGLQVRLPLRRAPQPLWSALGAAAVMGFLTSAGLPARAQDAGQNAPTSAPTGKTDKRVSVDAEEATLASVLTALMHSVGANYTLDSSLRTIRVTAHLHDLRLDTLLDVLLRSATPAVTYRLENGVYSFVLRTEPITPPMETGNSNGGEAANSGGVRRMQVVRVRFLDAAEAARLLGGIPLRVEGQTFGLVDPARLIGLTGAGGPASQSGGANGAQPGAAGGAGATAPANLLDYIWIVNAGAGF